MKLYTPDVKALTLLAALIFGLHPASALELTVIHTNDIHGWVMARPAKDDPSRMIGGAAALASFYGKQTGPKLLLDAGDWFQGTPEGTVSRGEAAIEFFNAIPYDAVVVGNHDFDMKEPRLKELASMIKAPVLGANVYEKKTHQRAPYLKPWFIKEISGVKVGLFGLLTTNMRNLSFPEDFEGLEFRDEIAEAKDAVRELKKLGATVIILLDHVGFEQADTAHFTGDQTIAREVEGIDLIVGGHTHTFLRKPYRDSRHGTLIVQAGAYLSTAGKVTLEVDDKTGRVLYSSGALVDLWIDQVGQDPQLLEIVAKQTAQVAAVYDVVIATAQALLTRNREGEASLGDWMTDCERAWAGANLAIHNGGGIRADMAAGPVTLRTIFNIMPFDNTLVKLDMDGGLVREALDHGVDRTKGMIQESGATFDYDRDAAAGRRLADLLIGGKAVDPTISYKVVTVDFLVKGGDGYSPFSRAAKTDRTRVLLRDVLADCAREEHLIKAPQGARMRAIDAIPR